MMSNVLGLYYDPWPPQYRVQKFSGWNFMRLFHKVVWYKANPRSQEYMQEVFLSKYPQGHFLDVASDNQWQQNVKTADLILLLYPDAIGLGFSRIESLIKKTKPYGSAVKILNGRKRECQFGFVTQCELRCKRFLEWTMLGEFLMAAVLLITVPCLAAWDFARGHK